MTYDQSPGRTPYYDKAMIRTPVWLPEHMREWLKAQPQPMSEQIREMIQERMDTMDANELTDRVRQTEYLTRLVSDAYNNTSLTEDEARAAGWTREEYIAEHLSLILDGDLPTWIDSSDKQFLKSRLDDLVGEW